MTLPLSLLGPVASTRLSLASHLLLGRFRHLRPSNLARWQKQYVQTVTLQFMTLHRSKGLEADYVFILGANSGSFGLPSAIEDDPLLHMVLPQPEARAFAEERRLFYVGLTRAKHRCHILTRRGRASFFIKDMFGGDDAVVYRTGLPRPRPVKAQPGPYCATGVRRERFDGKSKSMRCSNFPPCDHRPRGSRPMQ